MKIHGKKINAFGMNLPLYGETTCTLTIDGDTTTSAPTSARVSSAEPSLRSWKVTAQFRFSWALLRNLIRAMRGEALEWGITGDSTLPGDELETHWTFFGYAYITRVAFAAQGIGLISINLTLQGTGRPTWITDLRDRRFILGTSTLNSNHLI